MISIENKAKLFRGLADPARLRVLEMLRGGPHCVTDLLKVTGLLQPNLSMHLACLRDCGLVRARRKGRFVHYELADPAITSLLSSGEAVLKRIAAQIEACPRYQVNGRRRKARPGRVAR